MFGLILCGGKSLRMGSDKGLLIQDEKTWAQTALEKLKTLSLPVRVSINPQQAAAYSEIINAEDLIIDSEMSAHGPLRGLLSAHIKYPDEDIFALACDMPLMEAALLKELYSRYKRLNADAFVFINRGEVEPLCAVYRAKGLASILKMLQEGTLLKHSMKYMLAHLVTEARKITPEEEKYFRNFNAHIGEL